MFFDRMGEKNGYCLIPNREKRKRDRESEEVEDEDQSDEENLRVHRNRVAIQLYLTTRY